MRVLIVDDDPEVRDVLAEAFRMEGLDVLEASNGLEALLYVKRDRPDAVVLDLMMPRLGGVEALKRIHDSPPDLAVFDAALPSKDGIKLCKALRADEKLSAIPVLIIGTEKSQAAKAIEAGADDFLAKPIVLKELAQRAQMLIQRRQQNEAGSEAPLTGSVRDLGLLDLFQRLLTAGKSAVVTCEAYGREARVWVKEGQVIDAEFGALQGDGAFWRLMTWESGSFRAEFSKVERELRIEGGTQKALVEAMRKVEEVAAAAGELPMTAQLAVDYAVLAEKLADLPDEVNGVIRCFDGKRTLRESLDQSPAEASRRRDSQGGREQEAGVAGEAVAQPVAGGRCDAGAAEVARPGAGGGGAGFRDGAGRVGRAAARARGSGGRGGGGAAIAGAGQAAGGGALSTAARGAAGTAAARSRGSAGADRRGKAVAARARGRAAAAQ